MKIKRNVEIITKLLLFLVVVVCVVGSASAAEHTLTEAMGETITMDDFSPTLAAGDNVTISSSRTTPIKLYNIVGSTGSWINFTNPSDAQISIEYNASISTPLQVEGCRYIRILGNNYSAERYGIHLTGNSSSALKVVNTRDIEIAYIYLNLGGLAYSQCWAPWTCTEEMDNVTIHDNYIFDCEGEGMYLGKSSNATAPKFRDIQIYNNSVERPGWDGIQLGQTLGENNNIYNNSVNYSGHGGDYKWCWGTSQYQTEPCQGQWYGIVINPEHTGVNIYRNSIGNTYYTGISTSSDGTELNIHDNVVWNGLYNGIKVSSAPGSSNVTSNTVINFSNYGIATETGDTTGYIRYNLVIDNGVGGILSDYVNQSDNRVQASIPNEYFVNAAAGNFRLTSSSPARDAGTGGNYSTTDFDGVSRPQGTAADIGAFEFVESGNESNITSWENDKTSNDTLDFTINTSESVNFNATANQTITTWNWYKDDVDQSHNYDNISLNWSTPGLKHVIVNATNTNGTSSSITWNVTVESLVDTSDFTYYKIITINQSMINQSIGTGKYPLLVSDTDTDLIGCQADGDDIVFFDADNTTQLPHEQEFWNSTTGEHVHWTGIEDAINVSYIVMYYNNSTIANSENITGVWDSNYMMVQHFQETDIDGGADDIKDSTSNDNDGTTHNMTTANLDTGLIDGCFNFSKSNEARVNVSDDSTLDGFTSGMTVSGVFNFNQEGAYYLVNKYDAGGDQRAWLLKLEGNDNIRIYVDDAGTAAEISNFNPTIVPGTDYKIDAVWESGEYPILYVNGALANEVDHDGLVSSIKDSSAILRIAGGYSPGNTYFTSDEIRVSNIGRSQAYLETDTNNTLYPALFISFSAESGGAPNVSNITSWENNKTSNNTLDFTVNTSEAVNFNATANQTITTWNWYKDDADQSHNYDNITLNWSSTGLKHVVVNATNTNGTSSSITWNVTVESLNYIPPNPISLSDTTGNFWVNFTWSAGSGNVTDSYNVSQNGTWVNGSLTSYNNSSVGPHGYSNIIVYAYNSSEAGTLSVANITDNVTIPNNAISITNTSDWSDNEGQNVYVDYDASDADSDTPTFSCNRTDLFSDFNTATGIGNWQTDYTDAGIYYVDFSVSDGYGSTDNYTMTITVANHGTPGIPGLLSDTTGNFYVNFTWSAGANTDSFNVSQNSTWVNGSAILYNNSSVGPHGWSDISVYGYNSTSGLLSSGISDNVQVSNNAISISNISASYSIDECETLYIDADYTDADSDTGTFDDNSSEWNVNSGTGIVSWVPLDGEDGVYYWYINVNDGYGSNDQFNFTVTVNDTVTTAPTIDEYTNSISSTNMYPVVTNSGSVTFYASADQPVTTWTWYIDDVDQSNNADSFTTSWSKLGYKSVEVIAENAAGVSNMVEWNPYVKMAMAGAGDTVSDMDEAGYDNLIDGIGGDSPDFELVLWSFTEPYQVVVGNMVFVIIFGIPLVMFWIRQGSLIIPSVFGIVLGTLLLSFFPSSFAVTASAIIILSILATFYTFYKERR